MYISPSKKFAFIHIQKTGGSTIAEILKKQVRDLQIFGNKHNFARYGMRNLEDWESYYRFAFVRNPWDRLVSWYTMISSAGKINWMNFFKSTSFDVIRENINRYRHARKLGLWKYVLKSNLSFDEFVLGGRNMIQGIKGGHTSIAQNQIDYISDGHNKVIVDFVGRFENFQADLQIVCERLEIDSKDIYQPDRKRNPSSHKHYSQYYSVETRRVVANLFWRDIKYFGYRFEKQNE